MGFLSNMGAIFRNAGDMDWAFNFCMFETRADFETIDEYLGGRNWEGFNHPRFTECLVGEYRNSTASPESMRRIGWAWYEDDLYEKVLSGDAGVFAELWAEGDYDACRQFNTIVGTLLSDYALDCSKIVTRRLWDWSGNQNDLARWTDD